MKKLISNLILVVLFVVSLVSVKRWLVQPLAVPLDPDEVVWVLDAEASSWYATGDWPRFKITQPFTDLIWFEPEYRVIDQPQLGKYLIGFYLQALGLEPWRLPQKNYYYVSFMKSELPTGHIDQLSEYYQPELLTAVLKVRQLTTVVGLVAAMLAGYLVSLQLNNNKSGLVFFILVINNQLVAHYYSLAIVNSFSFLFQVLAVSALYWGWKKIVTTRQLPSSAADFLPVVSWGGVAGGLVAAAASVKLDGLFLVAPPFIGGAWVFLSTHRASYSKSTQAAARYTVLSTWFLIWLVSFLVAGTVLFVCFEPEIMINGINGFVALLGSRLVQQARFALFGDNLSWPSRVLFLAEASWSQPWLVKLMMGGLVLVSIRRLLNIYFKRRSFLSKKMSFVWPELNVDGFLLMVLVSIMAGSLYASRVGFDRYIIPAVIAGYLVWLKLAFIENKNDNT